METKPFNLQSPEQIAKDYGGNKQKIAQAASMGMVDPTAAVLAGMFIDRMRSAQMMEQQPQGTVAQQVFAPPQAPPMGAPPMGAPPQGAPMSAPPQAPPSGAAPQAPPMQPPGMAMGGLMDLSVPDDMFEEPTVDAQNFAGGGLVAFAAGGEADDDGVFYMQRTGAFVDASGNPVAPPEPGAKVPIGAPRLIGGGIVPSGRNFTVPTTDPKYKGPPVTADAMRKVAGLPGGDSSVFMPTGLMAQGSFDTPRSFPATPQSVPTAPAAVDRPYAGPPMTADAMRAVMSPPAAPTTAPRGLGAIAAPQGDPRPAAVPSAPTAPSTPAGPSGIEGYMSQFQQLMGAQAPTPMRDRVAAAAEAQLDPKAIAARKKQDMWQAVAQFGFNMAATNSPYFMQAAGQAGAATVPFMAASSKARKAAEKDALKQLADIEGLTTAEKKQALRDGFAYAARRVEQDEDMDHKRDVLAETIRGNKASESIARTRADRVGGRGSGGVGAPKFPGGMAGAIASAKYQEIMSGMEGALADPRNRAAYDANPGAWVSRYSLRARQTSLAYGAQEAKKKGDGVGRRSERRGATPSSGWGEMTVK